MTSIKVARMNESDDDDPYSMLSQCDATNEQNLDMYPGTLTFRNRGVEKDYLSDVAKQRWPVLLFIFCFDLICYIFRVAAKGVKLSATMSSASTCSQIFWEFAPQFGNMLLLYSFIGLLNRRSSRSGSSAAHQEESMISGLMSMAICSLLVSLTPDNASDYVYVAFFLICTSTFLKIRWWVGSAILIAPVVLVQMWQGSKNLPPDATVHIVVAWGVGALMTYLAEWYRRQTFANQKVAAIAMKKEVREAQARVKVQKELAEAQAQAAQRALVVAQEKAANDAKSEFMSLMCHEVRTPLNGCLASAEMLLETPLAEEQRELANTIRVSGSILLSTVSNFLDYFKMEAGKQLDIVRQPVQLQEVVADVHRIIEAMLGNNCGVTLQTPDTRWVPQVIYVDPDRLRGILLNLYTNAAKFTKQGYIHLRVRTVPHSSEPKVPDGYYSVRVTPSYSPDPRRSSSSSSRPPSLDPFGTYNTSSQPTSSSNRGFSLRDPSPTDSSPLTHSSASTPDHKHTRLRQLKAEFLEQTGRLVSGRTLRASLDSSSPCVSSKRSGADATTFRFGRKSCSSYGTSSIGGFGGVGMNSSTSDDLNMPTENSTGENNYMFDDDDTGNWLLFEVIDTGVGIAENELQALFKEFVQGTEAAMRKPRSRGGTGLGLSICAKQVSLLGGKIGAHSKLGSGSVFWFIIPERWGLPMTSRQRSHHNMIPSSDGAYRPRWSLDLHELNQQCLSPSQRLDQYRTRERGKAERVSEQGGEVGVENDCRREEGSYGELSDTARQVAAAAEDLGEHSWRAEREKRMAQYVYDNELVADHDSRLQDQQPGPAGRYSGDMAQQQAGVAEGREYVVGDQLRLDPAAGAVSTSERRLSESGDVNVQSGVSVNSLPHASDSVTGGPPTRGVSNGELTGSSHEGGRHTTSKARSSASFEEVLSVPSSTGRQSADHMSSATSPAHTTSTQLSLAPSNSRRSLNRERRSMQLATITESARGERGSFDSSKEPSVDLVVPSVPSKPVPPVLQTTKPAATEDGKTAEEAAGKLAAESAGPDPHHQTSVPTIWISTTCSVGNQPGTMSVAPTTTTTQPPAPPAITVVNNFSMHILSLLDNAALRSQISDQDMPGSITSVDPTLSSSAMTSSDPSISNPPTPSHATVTTTTTATFGSSNTSVQSSTPTFLSSHPQSTSHSPSQATNVPPGTVAWQIVNNTRAETTSVAPSVPPGADATPTSSPISIPTSAAASAPITSSSLTSEPSPRAASPLSSNITPTPDASPLASSPVSDNSSQIRKANANAMRRSTSNPIINSLTKNVRNSTERTRGCHSMDVSRRSILGDGQAIVSIGGVDGKGIGNTAGSGPGSWPSEKGRRSATFPAGSSGRLVGFMGEKTGSRLSQSTAGGAGQSQSLRMSLAGRPDLSMLVGRRALLVEDNLINQTVARKMLTSLGMVCEVASNGKEAIQAVEDALAKSAAVDPGDGSYVMFDVVLMDMAMPVMGGVEATRAIRSMGVIVPIVAMTANASEKDRDECRGAGMDGFLSKPVLKDRLGEAIIRVMHGQDCFNERSSRKHSFSA